VVPKLAYTSDVTWKHLQPRHAGMHPVHNVTTEFLLPKGVIFIILRAAHQVRLQQVVDTTGLHDRCRDETAAAAAAAAAATIRYQLLS